MEIMLKEKDRIKQDFEEIKKIFTTYKYNLFKFMPGNRQIDQIKLNGMITEMKENCPFTLIRVTNSKDSNKFEICDGQHTFLALKSLGKPINFYIVVDETIKDIRTINSRMKNWTNWDYVESFANTGYDDYILLKKLKDNFPEFKQTQFFISLALNKYRNMRSVSKKCIKDGSFKFTSYDYVLKILDQLRDFKVIEKVDYTSYIFIRSALYFLNYKYYVHARMIGQLKAYPLFRKTNDINMMIEQLLGKYNQNKQKKERIDQFALLSYIKKINDKK